MPELNMRVPATVSWSEGPLSGEMENGTGFSRHFETLAEAALFAAAELPEQYRGNTWISTEGHTFRPDEIMTLAAKAGTEGDAE